MTPRVVIDLQLEALFGYNMPNKIQKLIDEEMNQGRWVDGYHLAASPWEIESEDTRKLLEIVLGQYPALRIDGKLLRQIISKQLPASLGMHVRWIVHENGAYALTDGLVIARFDGSSVAWVTPRLSFDGIVFESLTGSELHGYTWPIDSDDQSDCPFTLNFETGEILKGQVEEY